MFILIRLGATITRMFNLIPRPTPPPPTPPQLAPAAQHFLRSATYLGNNLWQTTTYGVVYVVPLNFPNDIHRFAGRVIFIRDEVIGGIYRSTGYGTYDHGPNLNRIRWIGSYAPSTTNPRYGPPYTAVRQAINAIRTYVRSNPSAGGRNISASVPLLAP